MTVMRVRVGQRATLLMLICDYEDAHKESSW